MAARARAVLGAEVSRLGSHGVRDASPLDRAFRELARDPAFAKLDRESKQLAESAAKRSLYWVDDRFAKEVGRGLGVDVRAVLHNQGRIADKMQEFTDWNVSLIKTVPERFLESLGEKVSAGWAAGAGDLDELVDSAVDEAEVSAEYNADRIARDQTAKMNSAFAQIRQVDAGIERYEWSTSQDERTRETHAELDGKVFSWSEPGPLRGTIDGAPCHPGEDIQCRCVAIPIVDLDQEQAA